MGTLSFMRGQNNFNIVFSAFNFEETEQSLMVLLAVLITARSGVGRWG